MKPQVRTIKFITDMGRRRIPDDQPMRVRIRPNEVAIRLFHRTLPDRAAPIILPREQARQLAESILNGLNNGPEEVLLGFSEEQLHLHSIIGASVIARHLE